MHFNEKKSLDVSSQGDVISIANLVLYKPAGRDSRGTLESSSPTKFKQSESNKARHSLANSKGGADADEYTAHDRGTGTKLPLPDFALLGQSL